MDLAKPLPWVTADPFKILLFRVVEHSHPFKYALFSLMYENVYHSCFHRNDVQCRLSFWTEVGYRYSREITLLDNKIYSLRILDPGQMLRCKVSQLCRYEITRCMPLFSEMACRGVQIGSAMFINSSTHDPETHQYFFANNNIMQITIPFSGAAAGEVTGCLKLDVTMVESCTGYYRAFDQSISTNIDVDMTDAGATPIPLMLETPVDIRSDLMRFIVENAVCPKSDEKMQLLSNYSLDKSIFVEVDDVQLSPDILDLHQGSTLHVVLVDEHSLPALPKQPRKEPAKESRFELPMSPTRMFANKSGGVQSKSSSPAVFVYAGAIKDCEGHWTTMGELLYPSSARIDGAPVSLEVRVVLVHAQSLWQPGSVGSPGPATRRKQTDLQQKVICKGTITVRDLVEPLEVDPSLTPQAASDSSLPKTLRSGVYEVLLHSESVATKSIVIGKARLRVLCGKDIANTTTMLWLMRHPSLESLFAANAEQVALRGIGEKKLNEEIQGWSITDLRQNCARSFLLRVFKSGLSLPSWLLLSDASQAGVDVHIVGHNASSIHMDTSQMYFDSVDKDTILVNALYDGLTLAELVQALLLCGGRVIGWSYTMVKDYMNNKLGFSLSSSADWKYLRILHSHKYVVRMFEEEGDEDSVAPTAVEDGILLAVIRKLLQTLSDDVLCSFDASCLLLMHFQQKYLALVALWSFVQVRGR